jgi:hypothetical protein
VTFQTLFGNLELHSPRVESLRVPAKPSEDLQSATRTAGRAGVSPERLYLETKWGSLISFELVAHPLKDTLPVVETLNAAVYAIIYTGSLTERKSTSLLARPSRPAAHSWR